MCSEKGAATSIFVLRINGDGGSRIDGRRHRRPLEREKIRRRFLVIFVVIFPPLINKNAVCLVRGRGKRICRNTERENGVKGHLTIASSPLPNPHSVSDTQLVWVTKIVMNSGSQL